MTTWFTVAMVSLTPLFLLMDRLLISATKAKISPPFSHKTLRTIIIKLTAASQCKQGMIRYWLSSGSGDFSLSPKDCSEPAFYAVVTKTRFSKIRKGIKVITSTVPMKSPLFASMKSVNYLPNVLAKMEAEEKGASGSVWVDERGFVGEGPNMNVAFISENKDMVVPSFERTLIGCTSKRVLGMGDKLVKDGVVKTVCVRDIMVGEAKDSAEMMYLVSGYPVLPIIEWDGQPIGDGEVGKSTIAIAQLLWEDMISGPETQRVWVPYD